MRKAFTLLNSLLLLVLASFANGQGVNLAMELPVTVQAGSDFEVTLSITKGTLSDYSRFSQELPFGLTASNVSSPNADFSFEEQRVRIIWLKLPESSTIEVVYKIHVDQRLKGSFSLAGNFAYVVNEERKFANIDPSGTITITPNPSISQSLIVDIDDFESVVMASKEGDSKKNYAMVYRQKPVQMSDGSIFVQLLVKNPEGSKYAKVEETIPSGYLFEELESHQGIVSFGSAQVKFIWMKLPAESEFLISYKLVPQSGVRQEAVDITGIFTYTAGNDSFEDPVLEIDANLDDLSLAEKKALLLTGALPDGYESSLATMDPVLKESGQPEGQAGTAASSETGYIEGTKVLASGNGVYYRIQLIALGKPFNGALHFSRLGIDKEIRVEQHGGFYKYTAGTFTSYISASNYKKSIFNLPGMDEPFIVAYRNGNRISIEASLQDY